MRKQETNAKSASRLARLNSRPRFPTGKQRSEVLVLERRRNGVHLPAKRSARQRGGEGHRGPFCRIERRVERVIRDRRGNCRLGHTTLAEGNQDVVSRIVVSVHCRVNDVRRLEGIRKTEPYESAHSKAFGKVLQRRASRD